MTKKVFLSELRAELSGLPEQELNESLHFYNEMIDDRIEEGMPEEDAVAAAGDINEIAAQIRGESAATKRAQQGVRVWLIVLLAAGSPVWLALYVSLWACIISLWAVFVSFIAVSLYCFVVAVMNLLHGNAAIAAASLGAGLLLSGCTILMLFACKAATVGTCRMTKAVFSAIRRKERQQ